MYEIEINLLEFEFHDSLLPIWFDLNFLADSWAELWKGEIFVK